MLTHRTGIPYRGAGGEGRGVENLCGSGGCGLAAGLATTGVPGRNDLGVGTPGPCDLGTGVLGPCNLGMGVLGPKDLGMGVPGPGPGARARDGGVPGPGAAWRGGPGIREDEDRRGGRGARAGLVILGVGGLCGAGGVGRGCIII